MSVALTAGVCLLQRTETLSLSVTNIPWKRQRLRGLWTSLDKQWAPLGLEASLDGMEQSDDLVECGCGPKECGSVDSQEGWLRQGDWLLF